MPVLQDLFPPPPRLSRRAAHYLETLESRRAAGLSRTGAKPCLMLAASDRYLPAHEITRLMRLLGVEAE